MKKQVDSFLSRVLTQWVDRIRRRAQAVSIALLVATALLSAYTLTHLGINSDNMSLISDELPGMKAHHLFIEHFPNLDEAMFVVIDAETPELARESAAKLAERMAAEPDAFTDVYLPGGGEFFERNGLLYRSADELEVFGDNLAGIQPLIAELENDSSIENMTRVLRLGLDELDFESGDFGQWPQMLDQVSDATIAIETEFPIAVSWEGILLEGSAIEVSTRRVIVNHPVLDYADILVARRAVNRVRELAAELDLVPERGVRVRLTGNPALNYDEMIGIAWDVGGAGFFCFLIVSFVLIRALRSPRLVIAALVTLFTGLIWTAAYAALTVGSLNLLTISFAVIYLGLGVDFGIHLGMAYADCIRRGLSNADALHESARHVGASLFCCTLSTSIAFWVFIPSQFRGLAELGQIAGGSMFIIFFLTITFFPALVSSWLRVDQEHLAAELRFSDGWWNRVAEQPRAILIAALVAGIGGAALLPQLRLNSNVVEMRDPDTESVQAMHDLLEEPLNSPWYLNVLADDLDSANALAAQIDALDSTDSTITLASYIPEDQDEKLEILADASLFFEPLPAASADTTPPTVDEQLTALRELRDYLDLFRQSKSQRADGPLDRSILRLRDQLTAMLDSIAAGADAEAALEELERVLLASLPDQIARLRQSLAAEEISVDSLPTRLLRRMLAEDGTARIQIFPGVDLTQMQHMRAFVGEIKAFSPRASGMIINQVEMGRTTELSLYQSISGAFVAISLLLWLLWRRTTDVALAMAPLALGAVLTGATMVVFGVTFDFTNVVVIPLLFGIGVDSGIHLIQEERENPSAGHDLLGSVTARAVFYSSLTTVMSFGTLAFAGHNGLKGLGITLTLGLVWTVFSVLFVLPALMRLRAGRIGSASG